MRTLSIALPAVFAGLSIAVLSGFQGQTTSSTPTNARPTQTSTATLQRAQPDSEDGILAAWFALLNKNEVALARLAEQRAQDPEVKQFASKMIAAHEQLLRSVQPYATVLGSDTLARHGGDASTRDTGRDAAKRDTPARDAARDAQNREPNTASGTSEASFGTLRNGAYDHLALLQELSDQCLASSRAELEQKSGAEFDHCFVGMAIGVHMAASDMLTVFQRHASGELKDVFGEAQRTVSAHLSEAKSLAQKQAGKAGRPLAANGVNGAK